MQIGFVEYNSDKTETLICFVKLSCFLANRKHYILTLKLILRMKQKHAGSFLTGPLKRDQLKKHLESLLMYAACFYQDLILLANRQKLLLRLPHPDLIQKCFPVNTNVYQDIQLSKKKCNKYGILRYQIFSVQRNMF